jgi:hypothetical protein
VEGGELPSKLKQWYSYAYEFVQVVRLKTPKVIGKTSTKTEIDGLRYKLSVECAIMVAGNSEVTVKFKPLESAPPIVLVIRAVNELGPRSVKQMLEIDEDLNGIKKTYEVNPDQDFKYLAKYLQEGIKESQAIVA